MKIGIIGAGVAGLTIARLLRRDHQVELLEKTPRCGGIARTVDVAGVAYHVTGGHCFNSKYPEVLKFVFNEVLSKENWHLVERNANIKLSDHNVSYPIEYAVKEIFQFDPDLALDITRDFLAANDDGNYQHLEEWFRKKFGDTLADLYFIPYNSKIWGRAPKEMSPSWVEGKLPIPDKRSFFKGLLSEEQDTMPHAYFYYPNSNNQNTFIEALAKDLNIVPNYSVNRIEKTSDNKWLINADRQYDLLISTMPLDILPTLIVGANKAVIEQAGRLKYNQVTTMLWETTGTERTWTYLPSAKDMFHRYIHIGNFFKPNANYSITEAVGVKSYDEMKAGGRSDPFLVRPVGYHVSAHAYVIFDEHYERATKGVRSYLDEIGLFTVGRFGEWQYYNMDICIKSSMDLAQSINTFTK